MARIIVKNENIINLAVDVIVNAANERLIPGGGVCGAIHKAAGRELAAECVSIGQCAVGKAVITKAYSLKAKAVIHSVGPRYFLDPPKAPDLLASCYLECLNLAEGQNFKSIAFPCISTGVYGYPKNLAAEVAIRSVIENLNNTHIEEVIFCCFEKDDFLIYKELTQKLDVLSLTL